MKWHRDLITLYKRANWITPNGVGRLVGCNDGFADRFQLKLAGNCHPDLAGWKFRIHRIEPELPSDKPHAVDAPFDYSVSAWISPDMLAISQLTR